MSTAVALLCRVVRRRVERGEDLAEVLKDYPRLTEEQRTEIVEEVIGIFGIGIDGDDRILPPKDPTDQGADIIIAHNADDGARPVDAVLGQLLLDALQIGRKRVQVQKQGWVAIMGKHSRRQKLSKKMLSGNIADAQIPERL